MCECIGCGKKIRFLHKKGKTKNWHKKCSDSWQMGYDVAYEFCNEMTDRLNLPTPIEIFHATDFSNGEPNPLLLEECFMKIKLSAKKSFGDIK